MSRFAIALSVAALAACSSAGNTNPTPIGHVTPVPVDRGCELVDTFPDDGSAGFGTPACSMSYVCPPDAGSPGPGCSPTYSNNLFPGDYCCP